MKSTKWNEWNCQNGIDPMSGTIYITKHFTDRQRFLMFIHSDEL